MENAPKKVGRPRKYPSGKEVIAVVLTQQEKRAVRVMAAQADMSMAECVRCLIQKEIEKSESPA